MFTQPKPPLRVTGGQRCIRNCVVDAERNDCHACASPAELLNQLTLHLFRMYEDVFAEPILDAQGKPVEARIPGVSLVRIYIVHSQNGFLLQKPVIEH